MSKSKRLKNPPSADFFVLVVTNIFLAVAQKISRLRLAVRAAALTSLRLGQKHKTLRRQGFVLLSILQDSNLGPGVYKTPALPTELRMVGTDSISKTSRSQRYSK